MAIRVNFTRALSDANANHQARVTTAQNVCARAVQAAAAVYDGTAKAYGAFMTAMKAAEAARDATIAASVNKKNGDYFTVAQARIKIEGSPYPGGGNFADLVSATNAVMATGLNVSSVDFLTV